MTHDLLEYEVRRLPGVVAAAVDGEAVVVLVLPTVDADALSVVVRAMLAAAGLEIEVRVYGGMSSPSTRTRRTAPVVVGAAGGVAVFASVAVAAAMAGGFPLLGDSSPTPVTGASHIGGPAQVDDAPRPRSDAVVVPGPAPDWAADQGSWPLPASLPAAPQAVSPGPVAAAPSGPVLIPMAPVDAPAETTDDESGQEKVPLPIPGTGSSTPAGVNREEPAAADTDASSDKHAKRHGRAHQDRGRHLGWVVGPAHANERSSADSAPRGGRK